MNELKTTMRDCICKLIFLKWYCIDEFMLNFFIISSSNSNRGRSDSPRATDVVPLVSIQIVHAGNAFLMLIVKRMTCQEYLDT